MNDKEHEQHLTLDLPLRENQKPESPLAKWLSQGGSLGTSHEPTHKTEPWYRVLWLTGVDYFSTLGYQPGIALLAAGSLAPFATAFLVLVTLFGVLPIYSQVSRRSFAGQGSIALLENLLSGWWSKILVLVLLGFATTDFVITMTLSAADAALHAIENPLVHQYLGDSQITVTLVLLALLSLVFLKGFSEAIGLAMAAAIPYLVLNFIVLVKCAYEIFRHPELIQGWRADLMYRGDWTGIVLASAVIFPKLALGLSGFETGVSVMPLVSGKPSDAGAAVPEGRVEATRKLLIAAALIMSFFLLLSSFVTTILIPESAFRVGGVASGRAIAYLAHEKLGMIFGTIYDVSTILILWFAGASAMAGLLNLIPRYLPRFGMAPRWTAFRRPLVFLLFAISVLVTLAFRANVVAQSGAYATGVLVLLLSAAIAVTISYQKERVTRRVWSRETVVFSLYCTISGILLFTLLDNVIERPDGAIIASIFIFAVVIVGGISRQFRATELRVSELTFFDAESAEMWKSITGKKVHLVPLATNTPSHRARKADDLRRHYQASGTLAFVHIRLLDNRSEFVSRLRVKVRREGDNIVIEVLGAIAIANSIAYVSELLDPISIFIGLTRQNLMTQAFKYLFLGEGEVGLMVYTILLRYWEWTPEDDVRPLIFLMCE